MSARQATLALMQQLGSRGISLSFDEVNTLRRAQMVMHRWSEDECNGDIQRDEGTDIPWRYYGYYGSGSSIKVRVADREAGALRRVKAICEAHGLHFYHQTDPRGCALYVSNEPLPDHNYTRGIACCS